MNYTVILNKTKKASMIELPLWCKRFTKDIEVLKYEIFVMRFTVKGKIKI